MNRILPQPMRGSEAGSATQVMLATRCCATVGQKYRYYEGDQQQPCSSARRAQRVDQAGYRYKKNGYTRHGKQNHQCKVCERQFGATAEDCLISDEQRTMIEHLLRERISLRGISYSQKTHAASRT
jgi:hypothetical protein